MASEELSYYYGYEAEQFSFYRIPKLLFTDSRFAGISTDARLLYGILLDRMSLHHQPGKNGTKFLCLRHQLFDPGIGLR